MALNEYGVQLDRNGYAPSIIPDHSPNFCLICGCNGDEYGMDRHEIFHGSNRDKSKRYGLWVHLCHKSCHLDRVHNGDGSLDKMMKQDAQQIAMRHYGWSEDDFRAIFGKSYL